MELLPSPHEPRDDTLQHHVQPLNAAEHVWVAQHRSLVAELCDGDVDEWTVGHLFDRVHATWVASDERPDPAPLVHAFGVALGDLVVREVPTLSWASCGEADDVHLALSAPGTSVVLFPIESVDAHWGEAGDRWFTLHVRAVVAEASRRLTRAAGAGS
ncbi:DUF3806 domain-containing protein [Cellulomonas sp. HZM]|uniref:DUF3806 domain-containing protein n=1 Tax=Cellulomonas sp. HZM TaxID=1454010 RepID=UPI000A5E8EF7|nr:DUF3806 domain-containing protein [Cellulomonas sp. HZM]